MTEMENRYKYLKRIARFTLTLLMLGLCVSCGRMGGNIGLGPPEREIEKIYRPAEAMYDELVKGKLRNSEGNWNNVIRQLKRVAKDHPKSRFADDAQYRVGASYIQAHGHVEDSPQKAVKAFEQLIKRYPESEFVDDAYYWKAHAYFLMEDHERAMADYEKFTREYPQSGLRKKALHQIEEHRASTDGQEKGQVETVSQGKDYGSASPSNVVGEKDEDTSKALGQRESKQIPPATGTDATVSEEVSPTKVPGVENQQAIPGKISHVMDIRSHSAPEFTRVVVDLSGQVEYEAGKLEAPDRIYLDLQMATITPAKRTIEVNDKPIKNIRAAQFDETTVRIVLDLEQNLDYNIFRLIEPDRIVIDISASDALPLMPPPSEQQESVPLVKQLGLKVKTIVIDPGHGGKDPGAISRNGLQEKQVVLDVATRLKSLLESKGSYQIHLTRETDTYIPLKGRTNFANDKGADVFISIHINSCDRPAARGVETYYLSLASDEEARETAALENASSGRTIKDLNNILRYILRGAKVKESRELARTVQSQLSQTTGADDRGIKRAPFIVLIGAEAPSILVELGFISNLQDERLLRSEEYKAKLARALMEAMENYVKIIDQAS
ncbi:N-acetylmuramoyl-L-alanine amidase [Candidatus Poribacteria bacterium]